MSTNNLKALAIVFGGIVVCCFLVGCPKAKLGVCGNVPGVPGSVCVDLEVGGQRKTVILTHEEIERGERRRQ